MKKIWIVFFTMLSFSELMCGTINWSSSPVRISSMDQNASDAHVAMDSNGNAVAVWIQNTVVKATTKPVNGSWNLFFSSLSNSGASACRLAVDPSGNATAVWVENGVIKTSTLPFNGSWSAAHTLSTSGSSSPQIGVDSSGNVVAIWVTNGVIQSATKSLAGIWPLLPDILSIGMTADSPQVGVGPNGHVFAHWHAVSSVTGKDTIYAVNKLIAGLWGTATAISNSAFNSHYPQVAVDSSGNALAIWYRFDVSNSMYSNVVLQWASKSASGGWTAPADLSDPGAFNPANLVSKIANDSTGNAVAIWTTSFDGAILHVQTANKIANSSWNMPIDLVVDFYAYSVDLASSASGEAFVVYMASNSPTSALAIQTVQSDIDGFAQELWSSPFTLSQGNIDVYPRITAVTTGNTNNAAAVWIDFNGTHDVVQAITGSASVILPPSSLLVVQNVKDLGVTTELYNTLTWVASTDPTVVGYFVFRNGLLIGNVPPSLPLQIIDDNRTSGVSDTYGVAAYDSTEDQSTTVTIVFP